MRPAYRTGSSSEALSAARRTQLRRGLGLVLGVFLVFGLASCFLPGLLPLEVYDGLRVGELAAAAHVLVIALGVLLHDRHARRHVEPLAQRVVKREPVFHTDESGRPWASGASASASAGPVASSASFGDASAFNAFDSSRAFGARRAHATHSACAPGTHQAARATT